MLKSFYKTNKITFFLILCFLVVAAAGCKDLTGKRPTFNNDPPAATPVPPPDTSWTFGVMGDTQWTFDLTDPAGTNEETVSGSFISQMNQEFINHGVEFVVQVGDLTNYGYDEAIAKRAEYAQPLYDAGIGFFAMRGNHEAWGDWFPPNVYNSFAIPAIQANFPQQLGTGPNVGSATNFSSPSATEALPNMGTELAGISYAFDYGDAGNDATFVILDTWPTDSVSDCLFSVWYGFDFCYNYGYQLVEQQPWIDARLDVTTRGTEHAFVFSHQPLIAANHADSPFGFLDEHIDDQNAFYASLVANDVAQYIAGHDHLHHRSTVVSPDGLSTVEQVISAPACPKYYHADYSQEWRGAKDRQTVISTENDNNGYYIYTVDGPVVTVDYYSDSTGGWAAGGRSADDFYFPAVGDTSLVTPTFNFVKKETWRYSLNGMDFMVPQGSPYNVVRDTYSGTTVQLLGTNASTSVEDATALADDISAITPLTKRITTAWKDQPAGVDSNILMLAGLKEPLAATADKYILTMSTSAAANVGTRIVTMDSAGNWVDACTQTQNRQKFTAGSGSIDYAVGSYGFNDVINTAWVVLDYEGTFAIKQY